MDKKRWKLIMHRWIIVWTESRCLLQFFLSRHNSGIFKNFNIGIFRFSDPNCGIFLSRKTVGWATRTECFLDDHLKLGYEKQIPQPRRKIFKHPVPPKKAKKHIAVETVQTSSPFRTPPRENQEQHLNSIRTPVLLVRRS